MTDRPMAVEVLRPGTGQQGGLPHGVVHADEGDVPLLVRRFRGPSTSAELVRALPHEYASTPTQGASRMETLTVLSGELRGRIDGTEFRLGPGGAMAYSSDAVISGKTDRWARFVRLCVDLRRLPPDAYVSRGALVVADRAVTAQAVAAFCAAVLQSEESSRRSTSERAFEATLVELQTAVLSEMRARSLLRAPGRTVDRRLVATYIDNHFSDPGLSAGSIARALHVDVRTLHGVFAGSGTTVMRSVRGRRVQAVEQDLEAAPVVPPSGPLAAEHGFSGAAQMLASFRSERGCTPAVRWQQLHRAAPEPGRPR